jgi:adenylate kinase family enzyme
MKIAILGCSGSGKSTLANSLSTSLGIPHLELDQYFHLPNWTHPEKEEYREIVADLLKNYEASGWVIDGNYQSTLGNLVPNAADLVIWFNLKKWVVTYRTLKRTLFRTIFRKTLWNGNRESLTNLFKTDPDLNVVLWTWTQYDKYRNWGKVTNEQLPSHILWFEIRKPSDIKQLQSYLRKITN